ncbi:MAG: DUF945 family protein [Gammaproteobacteria bacterium]|nr:DUF945 family protein [Gammaproteobacteria bacterium]
MKKTLIGVALAAVIGGGGYFAVNKTQSAIAEFGDKQITAHVELYKKQPYVIKQLLSDPRITKAEWKVTQSTKDTINSVLTIGIVGEEEQVEIPLVSKITRGEVKYKEKSYGYGKIVTTPDVKKIKDLPEVIKADTLTNTTYIGLDGDLLNVTDVKPVKVPEENFTFQGLTAVVDTSATNTSDYDFDLKIEGFIANKDGKLITLEPFDVSYQVKNGDYTGKSSVFTFVGSDDYSDKLSTIVLGKGSFKGHYEYVDGLQVPISDGVATFEHLSVSVDKKPAIKFNNIAATGGYYKKAEKVLDLKGSLKMDVDTSAMVELMQQLPIKVTPESVSFDYAFNNIGYDVVNTYVDVLGKLDPESGEPPISETEKKALLQSLQKSGAGLSVNLGLKTAEGNADADMNYTLSEAGKNVDVDTLIESLKKRNPQQAMAFFEGKANLTVSKALAKATRTAMYLMMVQAKEEQDNYVINAELKDGTVTVNGQPMM